MTISHICRYCDGDNNVRGWFLHQPGPRARESGPNEAEVHPGPERPLLQEDPGHRPVQLQPAAHLARPEHAEAGLARAGQAGAAERRPARHRVRLPRQGAHAHHRLPRGVREGVRGHAGPDAPEGGSRPGPGPAVHAAGGAAGAGGDRRRLRLRQGGAADGAQRVRHAAPVAHQHGGPGEDQAGAEAHAQPHRRLQVPQEEAGAHQQAGAEGEQPEGRELGPAGARQQPPGAGLLPEAGGDAALLVRVPNPLRQPAMRGARSLVLSVLFQWSGFASLSIRT